MTRHKRRKLLAFRAYDVEVRATVRAYGRTAEEARKNALSLLAAGDATLDAVWGESVSSNSSLMSQEARKARLVSPIQRIYSPGPDIDVTYASPEEYRADMDEREAQRERDDDRWGRS